METNIQIIEYEDKTAKTGRMYTRFKTNVGLASAFDEEVIKPLKTAVGKMVKVELATDANKGFKNIRKFIEIVKNEKIEAEEMKPQQFGKSNNKNTTMYVSYAKDLCIELIKHEMKKSEKVDNGEEEIRPFTTVEYMKLAIELVKKAKEEFE